jgi:hypothetical protein
VIKPSKMTIVTSRPRMIRNCSSGHGGSSIVVQVVVALEALRRARWMIPVGWIAVGARHARRAAAALTLAVPGEIIVRLAHPPGVLASGALHCTPQDRRLSHHQASH